MYDREGHKRMVIVCNISYTEFFSFIFLPGFLVCLALRLKLAVISMDSRFWVCGISSNALPKICLPGLSIQEFRGANFQNM